MSLMSMGAFAQQMFVKPMVGGTLATITGDYTDDCKMKLGLAAGAEFGYMIAPQFAVTAGALVSMQGTGIKDNDRTTDYSTTLTYLNIPILANYYIIPGLAVKAGVQPGFLLAKKEKYTRNGHEHENTEKDGLKSLDLSIPLGLSYEISDFVIDARYNLGLTKINDSGSDHDSFKNSVIMLTVGYKIHL